MSGLTLTPSPFLYQLPKKTGIFMLNNITVEPHSQTSPDFWAVYLAAMKKNAKFVELTILTSHKALPAILTVAGEIITYRNLIT